LIPAFHQYFNISIFGTAQVEVSETVLAAVNRTLIIDIIDRLGNKRQTGLKPDIELSHGNPWFCNSHKLSTWLGPWPNATS
jgi:hypothetical protein